VNVFHKFQIPKAHHPNEEKTKKRITSNFSSLQTEYHTGPNHAFMYKGETSSSRQPTCAKLPKKKTPSASNEHNFSFKTFDASYVLTNKSGKVVAKFVGGKHKGSKTCVWVPKVLVSNAKGPKTVWVPKVKN
jgi:hypothetical protein